MHTDNPSNLRGAGELTKEIDRLAFVFSPTAKGALRSWIHTGY